MFGIYDGEVSLSWDEVEEWSALLGLPTVPVLYRGLWDHARIEAVFVDQARRGSLCGGPNIEGYVVRLARQFAAKDFGHSVAKFVRKGHVVTNEHWMHGPVVTNLLRSWPPRFSL